MTLAIILVVAAILALAVIVRTSFTGNLELSKGGPRTGQIQPIDIEAFRNLVDPAESDYLRRRLPASEFRTVQRTRLRATASYVRVARKNAAVLVRLGQIALASANPDAADAARQLVDRALLVRRNAAIAPLKIYAAMVWPRSSVAAAPILDGYMGLSGAAMLLGRLQNPAAPVRISSN